MPTNVKIEEPEEAVETTEEEPKVEAGLGEEIEEEIVAIEDADPEEEIWEGGPTVGDMQQWKEEYGDVYITSVTPERHIVWRTLTRFEFKAISKQLEQMIGSGQMSEAMANLENEEQITELCVIYPEYDRKDKKMMAGIASIISSQVMEASGFSVYDVRQM